MVDKFKIISDKESVALYNITIITFYVMQELPAAQVLT